MKVDTLNKTIDHIRLIQNSLPSEVSLVAAVKTRSAEEVSTAIQAGIEIVGHNYVQEAEKMRQHIDEKVSWHMIGHLQRNKVKKTIDLFDMIETLDSVRLAVELNKHCLKKGKKMPVLIEINSGKESNKTGILPGNVEHFLLQINKLSNLQIQGLMTMGPRFGNPEDARPYFKATRAVYDHIRELKIPNAEMKYLSMGMSNSYRIAIEEGANMVRIGTLLFGERDE